MATWIVHCRIADYFIKKYKAISDTEFVLGSVAPDCGYGKKDSFGGFQPPAEITHWAPDGKKSRCKYNDFYDKYLTIKKDKGSFSFYLGYYVHLLTDMMWATAIYSPTRIKYKKEYERDPYFLRTIKVDWYDLDYKYLKDNENFYAFRLLEENKSVKDYLPYYETGQLTKQIRFIADFYKYGKADPYRKYSYLTEKDVNNFIDCATDLIEQHLNAKQLI